MIRKYALIGALSLAIQTIFAQNLLQNSSFETNDLSPWYAWQPNGTATIVASNVHTGTKALQISGRQVGIEQMISGLEANTTYVYSVWVKNSVGAGMWVGVKDYGGIEAHVESNQTEYTKKQLIFKTGATNTSAIVYFYRHPDPIYGNTGLSWGDDFELVKIIKVDLGIWNDNILKVYERASDFSLTIRPTLVQGTLSSDFKLWYYWKDFFGNTEGYAELQMNVNNTILPPQNVGSKKSYSLVFGTNKSDVYLPERFEGGTTREYGVCFLTKTPTAERVASNSYNLGTLHLGDPLYDDPFLPSMFNRNQRLEAAISLNNYIAETNALLNKGFQPIPWISRQEGYYWNWDDHFAITDAQLQLLEQNTEGYFRANSRVRYWEVSWEENVHEVTTHPYYWQNLKKKIEVVRRAANRVSADIKLCYQVSTVRPSVDAAAFLASEAAQYYDVLALHSYKFYEFSAPELWFQQTIAEAKTLIQQYRPTMELWITETGAPNDPLTIEQTDFIRRLDMKQGSAFMAKCITFAFANGVKKVFWYNYHDKCTDINNIECQFGMIDYWGFPRASYATFYTILKNLRDKTFKRKIDMGNANVYVYEFQGINNENTIVAWTYPQTATTLNLGQLGIGNSNLVRSVLATDGSPLSILQNNALTLPDYPIFINFRASVIPVEWLDFTVQIQGSMNRLDWQTASEKNCKGFEIQRSSDANHWQTIGWVNGSGNSPSKKAYQFDDAAPLSMSYYRLRQVDYGGEETFSKTIHIHRKEIGECVLYPNPTNGKVQILTPQYKPNRLAVCNQLGQILIEKTTETTEIDLSNLPKGMYWVILEDENRKQVKKVVKQ